jgi:hypothetical protein
MSTQSSTIVQRVWNYCNVLRDDGISYGDYVERQLSVVPEVEFAGEGRWSVREVAAGGVEVRV